jgi:hypothetical protein
MVAVAVLTVGWTVRASGIHYLLRTQAFRFQNDWAQLPGEWRRGDRWPSDPAALSLIRRLHEDAIGVELPNTRIGIPEWPGAIWEE